MMVGFFGPLFQQLVALLSVFCIAPSAPAPYYSAAATGLPNIGISASRDVDASVSARREPLAVRVVQTQIDGLLGDRGIGMALANTADGVTFSLLRAPTTLRNALDSGGVAALPGGAATAAALGIDRLESDTLNVIDAFTSLLLENLALLPGGGGVLEPSLAIGPREEEFGALGRALLATPTFLLRQLELGPEAIPATVGAVGRQLVIAAASDTKAVVRAVSSAAQAALALIPGARVPGDRLTVTVREVQRTPGPLEIVVRIPIAVGVAASGLVGTGMRATTIVVRAVVTAVTDIADAARRTTRPAEEMTAFAAERPLTVPEALRQAPVTVSKGFTDAGRVVRTGTRQAAEDFNNTLRGRSVAQEQRLVTGGNDDFVADQVAVKPNRPRPVLGAIKTVTGTLKAVRNGIRTALGLPTRKPVPEKEVANQDVKESVS